MGGQPTTAHRPSQNSLPVLFHFMWFGSVLSWGFQESQDILRLTIQLKMTLTFLPSRLQLPSARDKVVYYHA